MRLGTECRSSAKAANTFITELSLHAYKVALKDTEKMSIIAHEENISHEPYITFGNVKYKHTFQ